MLVEDLLVVVTLVDVVVVAGWIVVEAELFE